MLYFNLLLVKVQQRSVFRKYSSFIQNIYQGFKELQYVDLLLDLLQEFKELQYADLKLDLQRTAT